VVEAVFGITEWHSEPRYIFKGFSLLLNPQQFEQCFLNWIQAISQITEGEVIALDGKSLRHSYDKRAELKAIHMVRQRCRRVSLRRRLRTRRVSAWATGNRLVLGQVKVDKKSSCYQGDARAAKGFGVSWLHSYD